MTKHDVISVYRRKAGRERKPTITSNAYAHLLKRESVHQTVVTPSLLQHMLTS